MVSDLNNELGINNKNAKKSLGAIVSQRTLNLRVGRMEVIPNLRIVHLAFHRITILSQLFIRVLYCCLQ